MPEDASTGREPTVAETASLVVWLRAGEPQAGAVLNQLYREALIRFCWGYLGDMDEVEDTVQDICYKVLSAAHIPDDFRPWLYALARNHCFNVLRGKARRRDGAAVPVDSQIFETMTGNLTRLVRGEQASRVSTLLLSMPGELRELLRLRYVEELSRAEIAQVLDMPESLVKTRLFEGLKCLREAGRALEES